MLRQPQGSEIRDGGRNHAHHHRTAAALDENVDSEAGKPRKSVRDVAGAMLAQRGDGLLVVADQVDGDVARVVGVQNRHPRNLHRDQLAIYLHLRRPARRENEVADLLGGAQHGAQ